MNILELANREGLPTFGEFFNSKTVVAARHLTLHPLPPYET